MLHYVNIFLLAVVHTVHVVLLAVFKLCSSIEFYFCFFVISQWLSDYLHVYHNGFVIRGSDFVWITLASFLSIFANIYVFWWRTFRLCQNYFWTYVGLHFFLLFLLSRSCPAAYWRSRQKMRCFTRRWRLAKPLTGLFMWRFWIGFALWNFLRFLYKSGPFEVFAAKT